MGLLGSFRTWNWLSASQSWNMSVRVSECITVLSHSGECKLKSLHRIIGSSGVGSLWRRVEASKVDGELYTAVRMIETLLPRDI